MSRSLAVLLTVTAGCLVGMQPAVNSRLGKSIGTIQAATVSFVVGTVALAALALIVGGGFGGLRNADQAPWWAFIGGLLGAVFVAVAIVAVRTLGASGLTAAVITGQLAMSVVIDRFGLLGIAKQQISPLRIAGLVLLAAGVALVVRK